MLGAARTVQIAGWGTPPVANARRTGTPAANSAKTNTAYGVTTSTAQFKFGTASMSVPTSNDELITSGTSIMNYGTGEFAIELWIYIPAVGTGSGHSASSDLLSCDVSGGFGMRLAQSYETNGLSSGSPNYINIFARAQADLDWWEIPGGWLPATWNFLAIQRKGTVMSTWVNGVLLSGGGSGGGTRDFAFVASDIKLGTADGSNGVGNAYIDEVCWSNTYRYTDTAANIPVPIAAFTVDSYTSQLLHMDGVNGGTSFPNATT